MITIHRPLAVALLLSANAAATEHDWLVPARASDAQPRFALSLSNRSGIAEAPFATSAFPEVSGFANVTVPSAALRLSSIGWLYVKLPIAYVRLDFPARAQVGEASFGNLELGVERGFALHRPTRLSLLAALLVPSADRGPDGSLLNNRALALASALNGNEDAALLTPGVAGLRLGASIEHALPPFQFRGRLDVPLLIRVSDANLPEETETHTLGLTPALELGAAWWLTTWFEASFSGALITEAVRVQEPTRERDRNRRLQPIIEPGLRFQLGQHVGLGLDGSIPLGGSLGGNAWSIATSCRLEL